MLRDPKKKEMSHGSSRSVLSERKPGTLLDLWFLLPLVFSVSVLAV